MEKAIKEICLKMPLHRRGGGSDNKGVTQCRRLENMRPSGCGDRFEPVGRPESYAASERVVPLGRFASGGGDKLLMSSGRSLVLKGAGASVSSLRADGVLPGSALCSLRTGADSTIVMTEAGASRVHVGDELSAETLSADYPAVTLRGKDGVAVTAQVGSRRLGASYSGVSQLERRDAEAVANDLAEAYMELCAKASAAGALLQPCLVRYRLFDADGHELFVSPAVLVGHSTGAQCASTVPVYSSDRQNLNAYTLSASTWTLEARFPDVESMEKVASCEIYVGPMFHPYHPDRKADIGMGRGGDSSVAFLNVGLPGRECGLGTSYRGQAGRLVMKALARMDAIEERVATVYNPFSGGARTLTIDFSPAADAASASKALHAAFAKPVGRIGLFEALLSRPHVFSAACCAADAQTAAWGDLTVHRYCGYSPAVFAVATADRPWQAVTVVRFGEGRGVVRLDDFPTGAPTLFGPVLSYPSPDAVEMIINVTSGGVTRSQTFALRPDASGRNAVYVADGMCPFELSTLGVTTQTVSSADERFADAIAFAPTDDPLAVDSIARTSGGAVKAIAACRGRDQSWEFGRCRFVAGSEGCVFSVVLSSGRRSLSVRKSLSRGICRGDAIACGDNGEVFVLAGDAGGAGRSLVRFPASGGIDYLSSSCRYDFLAYNSRLGELWAFGEGSLAEVFCRDYGWNSYFRSDLVASAVAVADGEPFALCAGGVAALCRESRYDRLPVIMDMAVEPERLDYVKVARVSARLCGDGIDGRISVQGLGIDGDREWPMSELRVVGECRSPLGFGIVARPCRVLGLCFAGTVSGDFVFDSFKIAFTPWHR